MSLDFTSSGSRVDHGSAASLDNIPSGPMTAWAWVYRIANGSNQHMVTKDNTVTFQQGWGFAVLNTEAEGQIGAYFLSNGGESSARSGSGAAKAALNTWTFVAVVLNASNTPNVKLYNGTLSSTVAEVSSYAAQVNTVIAYGDDSAFNLYVGNLQRSSATFPFKGSIQRGGLVARALSLGELATLQFASAKQIVLPSTRLAFNYDGSTGVQPDLSGNLNNGTVTTAVRGTPGLLRP